MLWRSAKGDTDQGVHGANCGAADTLDVTAANAVVEGTTNGCPVGGNAVAQEVAGIMGVEPQGIGQLRVLCNGRNSVSKEKYEYQGIDTCAAAASHFGGHKACTYGCLGHGDCKNACPAMPS